MDTSDKKINAELDALQSKLNAASNTLQTLRHRVQKAYGGFATVPLDKMQTHINQAMAELRNGALAMKDMKRIEEL